MRIERVRALQDNYVFVLVNPADREAVVIDPGQGAPVLGCLDALGVSLAAIWHTHHHHDHIGGDRQLLARYPQAKVYGNRDDAHRIPTLTHFVEEGDRLTVGDRTAQVMFVPGHTRAHLAYYFPPVPAPSPGEMDQVQFQLFQLETPLEPKKSKADSALPELPGELFCGDTIFSGGCGRLFEGTPEQMVRSLSRFRQLPDTTRIWCAHEYTQANLAFAETLIADEFPFQTYVTYVEQQRAQHQATIPTTLKLEKQINPFLRWDDPKIQQLMGTVNAPFRTFARLRGRKDLF